MKTVTMVLIISSMVLSRCAVAFVPNSGREIGRRVVAIPALHQCSTARRRTRSNSSTTGTSSSTSSLMGRATFLLHVRPWPDDISSRKQNLQMTSSNEESSSEESPSESPSAATSSSADVEQYQNKNNVRDQIVSAISADGGIKVTACTVRNMVNDMMIMHNLTPVPIDALGRAVACSVLVSNGMQDEQVFQLTVDGDGPLRGIVAISSGRGEVRGYVGTPMLGDMSLQEAVGKGVLKVVKNHPSWPTPYNGISAIRHSDIDRDVGAYLAESEQRSCALAAATSVEGILTKAAGGYLVERLPECDDETMGKVEQNLATLVKKDGGDTLPTNLLLRGVSPYEICEIILDGLDMQPLQQIEPVTKCQCTEERLFRALRLLPKEEVDEILEKEDQIEARCHFCGKVYRLGPDEVEAKFAQAKGDPSKDDEIDV